MLTKFRAFLIILVLLAASGSYALGRGTIDIGQAITDSRCSAGAFIAHAKAPSSVQADVHSDEAVTLPDAAGLGPGVEYAPVTLTSGNLVPNGNLETSAGTHPRGWDSNAYGRNDGRFTVVAGYGSRTGLRIDVGSYTDGTADWFTGNLAVTPGAYYQFQDNYRSNVTTRAVLMLKEASGKQQFVNLDTTAASDGWALYTQRFFVPADVTEIQISHPLDRAGWLETDNYTLQSATAPGFATGMVSLTFDDGWRSIHDNALPLLNSYGVVSTQYLVSGFLGQLNQYMTPGQVYDFTKAGHEVASHTYNHPDLTKLSDQDLQKQVKLSHDGLTKCYGDVADFAPPFGASNAQTTAAVKSLYETSRSTEVGFNSPDALNPYQLKVENVRADTTPMQMRAWLTTAKQNHTWLILVYHQVAANGGEYSRSPADFETDLVSVKASGLSIETMHSAYLKTQNREGTK